MYPGNHKQRIYASLLMAGAILLWMLTLKMIFLQSAFQILIWWAILLLCMESFIDLIWAASSLRWLKSGNPFHSKLALRLGAVAIVMHALRVFVYVLGRTGPWYNFDVKPLHRSTYTFEWFWVWFAATLALLGVVGVLIISLLKRKNKNVALENRKTFRIRELEESEESFMVEMLYQSIYIHEGLETLSREIIYRPELYRYIDDFGRKGDFCLVAEYQEEMVGAIWVRLFDARNKGYGYVDEQTPELGMAVLKPYRNSGLGTTLLKALFVHLKRLNYSAVSLSVDRNNYAHAFYRKHGFVDVQLSEKSAIMLKKLK